MTFEERVVRVIFRAIDGVNEHLDKRNRLQKSLDTVLSGEKGKLDSLGLVNFIVGLEQEIEKEFGVSVNLIGETTILQYENPFRSVRSLAGYVTSLLKGGAHG